jgi:predicted nicotinamide N-methyase
MPQIQLQIPCNAEEGDLLTCHYNGNDFDIPVPVGSKPGDVLQIEIAEDENVVTTDKDCEATVPSTNSTSATEQEVPAAVVEKIALHESVGVTLEMHNSIPTTDAEDDRTDTAGTHEEVDALNTTNADGTNAMVWPAGRYLAEHISSPIFDDLVIQSTVAVELGSGLGVGGLAFAATASRRLAKRKREVANIKVFLTDLLPALPLLRVNVEHNKSKLSSSALFDNIAIQPLEWGNSMSMPSFLKENDSKTVDLVIASDLLYNTSVQTYKDLVKTIDAILNGGSEDRTKKTGGKLILSVRWRKPQEEREFFKLMVTMGYSLELQKLSPTGSDLTWKEYGDPSCAKSNEFFTYTKVKVSGEYKALKDIDETDMDSMDDTEFEVFESKFLQIYIGEKKFK